MEAARIDDNQTSNTGSAVQTFWAESEVIGLREVVLEEPSTSRFFGRVSLDRSLLRRNPFSGEIGVSRLKEEARDHLRNKLAENFYVKNL